MAASNTAREILQAGGLFVPGFGYILRIGTFGSTSGTIPSDTNYCTGCILINYGGGADYQVYINEGAGFGSSPTWTSVGAVG